jgi:hypothetical protein
MQHLLAGFCPFDMRFLAFRYTRTQEKRIRPRAKEERMQFRRSKAAIIITVFTIAVCTVPFASGTPPDDACSLLTQARVSSVLGVSVGAGQPISPTNPRTCGWSQPNDANHTGKRVVFDVFGPIGKLTPMDRFTNGKTPIKGITKTPVSGIGDDAYFITTPGLGTGLNVKKGNSVFQIRVYGFSQDQIEAMEKALAQDALAKL